jgi:hypothetical protein
MNNNVENSVQDFDLELVAIGGEIHEAMDVLQGFKNGAISPENSRRLATSGYNRLSRASTMLDAFRENSRLK